jgi:hypothetical protein
MESLLLRIPEVAIVRATIVQLTSIFQSPQFALAWISIGLAILLAAAWWPAIPEVTAMAIVTLGATGVTLARFRSTSALWPALVVHVTVYGTLYALFVGATLHAAGRADAGPSLLTNVDLVASAWFVAFSLDLTVDAAKRERTGD